MDGPSSPQARFHHTLTVIPRHQATGEGPLADLSHDFLVMVGGHNRHIEPILGLHVFTLRDASFAWPDHESLSDRRVGATATWCAQPRQPEPPGRGFHSAAAWRAPWTTDFVVVSCGVGAADDSHGRAALADTWLFDASTSTWIELLAQLPIARSRAASAIVRGQLVLCGGCRQPTRGNCLAPGTMLNDVWLLDLLSAVEYDALQYSTTARQHPWTRCVMPTDTAERPCHVGASATALHGGKVLIIMGGYSSHPSSVDEFGDSRSDAAWALQETQAVSFGLHDSAVAIDGGVRRLGIHTTSLGTRVAASCLVSRGAASYPGVVNADEMDTLSNWVAAEGTRVLVHAACRPSRI